MTNPIDKILDSGNKEIIKQVLENSPNPCALADSNRNLQWFNEAAQSIFESSNIGTNVFISLQQDDKAIDEQTTFLLENIEFSLKVTPLSEKNVLKGYLLLFTSTSEAQPLTAHNLAHDLNNIFTSILNSIELLKTKPADSEKHSSLLNNIESSSIRAAEIIEDVLVKVKDNSYNKRKINIGNILTEAVNNIKPTLSENITLNLDLHDNLKPVYGKYNDLFRVLINLCVNAKEAIKKKGAISICAKNVTGEKTNIENLKTYTDEYVTIVIKDSGAGINKEHLSRIFDTGFSTKQKKHQSGLGLNIVKQIIEKHDGTISVRSVPGEFTEFTIVLPAVAVRSVPEKTTTEKTILIAEDEFTLRELLVELLSSYNYNVIDASDGKEVLGKYEATEKIDLMIVDRKMPELDGLECIKKIREKDQSVPIILASGSPTDKNDKIIDELNINRVVNKPYDFEYLLSNIEELIG